MLEWIYYVKAEGPPENYIPKDKCVHQGHQTCTSKKGTSLIKKFTGGPALLARANIR